MSEPAHKLLVEAVCAGLAVVAATMSICHGTLGKQPALAKDVPVQAGRLYDNNFYRFQEP